MLMPYPRNMGKIINSFSNSNSSSINICNGLIIRIINSSNNNQNKEYLANSKQIANQMLLD